MSSITIKMFNKLSELETIADEWDELVLRTGRSPMLSWSWVSSHFEYNSITNREWLCLVAFDTKTLIGVLPIVPESTYVFGRQVTILRQPIGLHIRSVDAVILTGREKEVLGAFIESLDKTFPNWFAFELKSLHSTSPIVTTTHFFTKQITKISVSERNASVCITDVNWNTHFNRLSSKFRKSLRKHRNRLMKLGNVSTEFFSGDDVSSDHLDIFISIEASGWKGRLGSAIGEAPERISFYHTLLERLHRRKAVEWHFLKLNDEYIAGHLIFRSGNIQTILKIGYLEKYSKYSPGTLLKEESLRSAFDDPEIIAIDFVTDHERHNSWQPQKFLYHDVWLYPRRPFSIIFGMYPRKLKQLLRRVPGLKRVVRALCTLVGR